MLRSLEKIHHFKCKFCDKWWSVGDAPVSKKIWFCAWCGKENRFGSLEEYDIKEK